ncbi:unnamed protein product [Rotaria magnacalcarata]|uniref:Uncharacterized protein n=2 Tax=Rotaria magnacalcarata TaxID=392030 RepID=A0A816NX52_9BILA|nr:unnamed protein product [Rotaria magnacalcarata]CAF2040872.1 unnamed protein product [Rotaria magnacalcarata]CAF3809821.1 unnamed protein product [Rotaria magnacalcarata]
MNRIQSSKLPQTITKDEYEDISDEEDFVNKKEESSVIIQSFYDELIVHVTDELTEFNENESCYYKELQNAEDIESNQEVISSGNEHLIAHGTNSSPVQNDLIALPMKIQPLSEIMKLNFRQESNQSITQAHDQELLTTKTEVHVRNEPEQVSNFNILHSTTQISTPRQIRNRKINRRHRANRYRFEVIRHVYRLFNITKIKQILESMNICYVNINMVRCTLFIGVKNQTIVDEVEKLLHDRIFTEQHYNRLYT